ncbi:MAG: hypothetical protein RIB61_18860 [Roseicyclus sp.]|jgi:hypothetical protein
MFVNARARVAQFLTCESGASTIQWVILTASCMAITLSMIALIGGDATDLAGELPSSMDDIGYADGFPDATSDPDANRDQDPG